MAKRWSARPRLDCFWPAGLVAVSACGGSHEAPRVDVPVVVESGGMAPIQTNLGYAVELSDARLALEDLEFAIAGEAHSSLWQRVSDLLVPVAHAHPGHYQGGEITGELPGHFILDWLTSTPPAPLGMANLIVGNYQSVNFTFAHGEETDGLASDDPLLGHTAVLRGQAARDGQVVSFEARVDAFPDRQLVGAPFEAEVRVDSSATISVELLLVDPLEGGTLLDDIDFQALPADANGVVKLSPGSSEPPLAEAYDGLRRTLQTHDHFKIRVEDGN